MNCKRCNEAIGTNGNNRKATVSIQTDEITVAYKLCNECAQFLKRAILNKDMKLIITTNKP